MGLLDRLRGRGRVRPPFPPPTYSNSAVIERIQRDEGVDLDTARAWFQEMLVFLDLCDRSKDVLSPPTDVDKAWHAFLLHSRDYATYCHERFGHTIWHDPTGDPDPQAYRRAYQRRLRYGRDSAPDPAVWAVPAGFVAGSEDDDDEDGQTLSLIHI